jgi:hypothetical protein
MGRLPGFSPGGIRRFLQRVGQYGFCVLHGFPELRSGHLLGCCGRAFLRLRRKADDRFPGALPEDEFFPQGSACAPHDGIMILFHKTVFVTNAKLAQRESKGLIVREKKYTGWENIQQAGHMLF